MRGMLLLLLFHLSRGCSKLCTPRAAEQERQKHREEKQEKPHEWEPSSI